MLTVETIGRIRREHFIKGKTIKEIARDLKVSRNTARRVLRSGATSFEYERDVQPRPKLGRWTEELDGLLVGNAVKPAREQLTLIRIFEELRASKAVGILRDIIQQTKFRPNWIRRMMRLARLHQIYSSVIGHFGIFQTSHAQRAKRRIRIFLPFEEEDGGPCCELIGHDWIKTFRLQYCIQKQHGILAGSPSHAGCLSRC
jgi:hypothetical protein